MIPDQVYLWGWPQWVAIVALGVESAVRVHDRIDPFGEADAATVALLRNLLWAILLGAGGFWS